MISVYETYLRNRLGNPLFSWEAHDTTQRMLVSKDTSLMMIDFDLKNRSPCRYNEFKLSMKYPDILPGGYHCMMSMVRKIRSGVIL